MWLKTEIMLILRLLIKRSRPACKNIGVHIIASGWEIPFIPLSRFLEDCNFVKSKKNHSKIDICVAHDAILGTFCFFGLN